MSSSPIVILTGGSRGLGLAILQLLLKHNARVTTLSRSLPDELKSLQEAYPDHLEVVQGDVGNVQDNTTAVRKTVERWGGIDSLVLNAGNIKPTRLADEDLQEASAYVSANLLSVLYMTQPALSYLRKSSGRVVLVSSGASAKGYTSWGLYSMVKAGMNSLARTLANEEKGLSVWAIRPGLVDTSVRQLKKSSRDTDVQMQGLLRDMEGGVMDPEEHVKFTQAHEKGQLLAPELPGGVIAGLAVDGPRDLSGEYLEWADDRLTKYKLE